MVRTRTRNRNEEAANREPAPAAAPTQTRAAGPRRDAPVSQTQAPAATSTMAERERDDTAHHAQTQEQPTQTNLPAPMQQRALGGVNARNAFEAYGQQMSVSSITGTLIKFNKGDWVTGEDEDLEEDLELVANMDQLMVGWIKWMDQRPAEQIMGPVAEGYQPGRRNELGDMDQNQWETDNEGRPRDPWQFSNYIVMKEPGQPATEENLYTFATSSKGGLGAIGAVCREFGKEMRTRPDEYPIVRLGSDSYNHREYGRTKVPVLTIVGWEPKAQFETPTLAARPEPEPASPPARGRSRNRAA